MAYLLATLVLFASLAVAAAQLGSPAAAPTPEMPSSASPPSSPPSSQHLPPHASPAAAPSNTLPSPPPAPVPSPKDSFPSKPVAPVAAPTPSPPTPSTVPPSPSRPTPSPAVAPSNTFPSSAPVPSPKDSLSSKPVAPIAAPTPSPPTPSTVTPTPSTPTPSPHANVKLKVDFYKRSCPKAEEIIRKAVKSATSKNPGIGAGLIRLHFHECFVQGCDASVLLDPTPANPQPEKLSPPNFPSLRGFEVIDAAKEALEKACPRKVSCADILAFAARDASYILSRGKIDFEMPAGRLDGRVSLSGEALQFLPPPFFDLPQLIANFKAKNLDEDDLVVLSGAHTIGVSHCSSFTGFLAPNPPDMDPFFAAKVLGKCNNTSNDPTVAQDIATPDLLDNRYYKNILKQNVLFASDEALMSSQRTSIKVLENAFIPNRWEMKFAKAMVKMAAIELKTAANGEIRRMCRAINN